MSFNLEPLALLSVIFPVFCVASMANAQNFQTMASLSDTELSAVNGQALISLSHIAPNDSSNKMSGQGVGFYKLGLERDLNLNVNIRKLQLGCGGVNGAGGCDIDIDNLSLSGISDSREGRAGTSAKLTNPFIELAIKNPNSASTRELLGLRLSADKVLGLLTMGDENRDSPNGLNSFSGSMRIKSTTGTATTQSRTMNFRDTNQSINGKISLLGGSTDFTTNDYTLNLSSTNANLQVDGTQINGTRLNSVNLNGTAQIGDIDFNGRINAVAYLRFPRLEVPVTLNATGSLQNLKANLTIQQNLGFIHKLPVNNPLSLSLQQTEIHWPGATFAANRGWWLALEDEIDIGQVTPANPIIITNDVLTQVVPQVNNYLNNNVQSCFAALCAFTGLNMGKLNLSQAPALNFPIKDLKLATQNFAPNCYGNLKFC